MPVWYDSLELEVIGMSVSSSKALLPRWLLRSSISEFIVAGLFSDCWLGATLEGRCIGVGRAIGWVCVGVLGTSKLENEEDVFLE